MAANINETLKKLIAAQASLAEMDSSERMLLGEKLAAAFRKSGLLQSASSHHEAHYLNYQVVAGALDLTINASYKPPRSTTLTGDYDLNADITF